MNSPRFGLSPTDIAEVEAIAADMDPSIPATRIVFYFDESANCIRAFDVDLTGKTEIANFTPDGAGWASP